MNRRNKTVRIADKYGWDVVKECQDDSITDDADDATKLRQAIFRAKKRNNRTPYERTNRYRDFRDISMNVPVITVRFFFMIDQWEMFFNCLTGNGVLMITIKLQIVISINWKLLFEFLFQILESKHRMSRFWV